MVSDHFWKPPLADLTSCSLLATKAPWAKQPEIMALCLCMSRAVWWPDTGDGLSLHSLSQPCLFLAPAPYAAGPVNSCSLNLLLLSNGAVSASLTVCHAGVLSLLSAWC